MYPGAPPGYLQWSAKHRAVSKAHASLFWCFAGLYHTFFLYHTRCAGHLVAKLWPDHTTRYPAYPAYKG